MISGGGQRRSFPACKRGLAWQTVEEARNGPCFRDVILQDVDGTRRVVQTIPRHTNRTGSAGGFIS